MARTAAYTSLVRDLGDGVTALDAVRFGARLIAARRRGGGAGADDAAAAECLAEPWSAPLTDGSGATPPGRRATGYLQYRVELTSDGERAPELAWLEVEGCACRRRTDAADRRPGGDAASPARDARRGLGADERRRPLRAPRRRSGSSPSIAPPTATAWPGAARRVRRGGGARARGRRAARCLVITGSGATFRPAPTSGRSCSARRGRQAPREELRHVPAVPARSWTWRAPVIGALNASHAVGGGFGLAMCCDLRDRRARREDGASASRAWGWPKRRHGHQLPAAALVGVSRAAELLFTGRLVDGEREAEQLGLLSAAVPADEVLPRAMELAVAIAASAPAAVRETKRALYRGLGWDPRGAAYLESFAQAQSVATADAAAASIAALLEKREPRFTAADGPRRWRARAVARGRRWLARRRRTRARRHPGRPGRRGAARGGRGRRSRPARSRRAG
ncbi:MAG: enoyl-CoA hydratase/isomerase family protein [Kofleriaceae bacterium]|nr:enoyl-CoA hydratase/isomerase family protein [Kofleriaceae bacterium]